MGGQGNSSGLSSDGERRSQHEIYTVLYYVISVVHAVVLYIILNEAVGRVMGNTERPHVP